MTVQWNGGPSVQAVPSGSLPVQVPSGASVQPVPVSQVTYIGPSAYDLAVEQGFVGTLDQWLASLHDAAALQAHVDDPEPHPAYDDMPDLTLFYVNRKA